MRHAPPLPPSPWQGLYKTQTTVAYKSGPCIKYNLRTMDCTLEGYGSIMAPNTKTIVLRL